MLKNRFFALLAATSLAGLAACDAGEEPVDETQVTTQEVITETDTTLAPVVAPVVETDTGLVETTVEADVDVDRDTVIEP